MPLNRECIGKELPPITTEVKLDALQKYARACNEDNPAYFDASRAGGIVAPPMFAVVVTWQPLMGAVTDPAVGADLLRLVHGEQDMEFLRPIRPGDVISARARVASIETKSSGETLTVEVNATARDGAPVNRTVFSAFIRGAGGRGSSQPQPEPDRGKPLVEVAQTIDNDQTYRYAEASGDPNPIHVDPNVAKMAGLPGIIVHGLCTMAFTARVMVDHLCERDPLRLKRVRVRFSRPVFPGQTITTRVWTDGERDRRRIFAFETFNPDGQPVIRGGIAEVS